MSAQGGESGRTGPSGRSIGAERTSGQDDADGRPSDGSKGKPHRELDPVFHEGLPVETRVLLRIQFISERSAARLSKAMYIFIGGVPLVVALQAYQSVRTIRDPAVRVRWHIAALVLAGIALIAALVVLAALLRACWKVTRSDRVWTRAQRRLISLRAWQLVVQALQALLVILPSAKGISDTCSYADDGDSLVRWCFSLRSALALLGVALKIRGLLLVPASRKRHAPLFRFCCASACRGSNIEPDVIDDLTTPRSPVPPTGMVPNTRTTDALEGDVEDGAAAEIGGVSGMMHNATRPLREFMSAVHSVLTGNSSSEITADSSAGKAAARQRHKQGSGGGGGGGGARQGGSQEPLEVSEARLSSGHSSEVTGAGEARLPPAAAGIHGGDGGHCARRSSCESDATDATAETQWAEPPGGPVVPLFCVKQSMFRWAWHAWAAAFIAFVLILWDALTRKSVLFYGADDEAAFAPNEADFDLPTDLAPTFSGDDEVYRNGNCPLRDLQCVPRKRRMRVLTIPALILAGFLVIFFLVDVLRARYRLRQQLYMPLRHVQQLLTVEIRFGLAAIIFAIVGAGSQGAISALGATSTSTPEDQADPNWVNTECLRLAIQHAGNPLDSFMKVATAILGALIIWPWVGPPGEEPDLWEHRQRFAWTDDKIEEVREQRTRDSHGRVPHDEPVFSMQRCAMLYFWACFVYQYTEVESLEGVGIGDEILGILGADADHPQPAFDALMAMFDLTDYKLFWERTADTKALVAWSKTCVLVAFRGTTTVVNARMDLQIMRTRVPDIDPDWEHPSGKSCICSGRRPKVHSGFQASYESGAVKSKILMLVLSLLESGQVDVTRAMFYTTGHSLGGALAALCAIDIARSCKIPRSNVVCYTYGCPRIGNHAYRHLGHEHVPETWHVINDQDVVAKSMKFGCMFKRCGQRVVVSDTGRLAVRPSFFEFLLLQNKLSTSVMQHMLNQYARAIGVSMVRHRDQSRTAEEAEVVGALRGVHPAMRRYFDQHTPWQDAARRLQESAKHPTTDDVQFRTAKAGGPGGDGHGGAASFNPKRIDPDAPHSASASEAGSVQDPHGSRELGAGEGGVPQMPSDMADIAANMDAEAAEVVVDLPAVAQLSDVNAGDLSGSFFAAHGGAAQQGSNASEVVNSAVENQLARAPTCARRFVNVYRDSHAGSGLP